MRYSIHIDQLHAMEWGLNPTQACLFSYLYTVPSWVKSGNVIIHEDEAWYRLSRTKIIEDLPFLTEKKDTVYRLIKQLEKQGVIVFSVIDGMDCLRITDKGKQWYVKPSTSEAENNPATDEDTENNPPEGNITENFPPDTEKNPPVTENFPTNRNIVIKTSLLDNQHQNVADTSDDHENKTATTKNPDAVIEASGGKQWGTKTDLDIAKQMADAIARLAGDSKPPNLAKWANDIRLMRDRDQRQPEHIVALFHWANHDPFWSSNILSPSKLREKWVQLAVKRNSQARGRVTDNSDLIDNLTDEF